MAIYNIDELIKLLTNIRKKTNSEVYTKDEYLQISNIHIDDEGFVIKGYIIIKNEF